MPFISSLIGFQLRVFEVAFAIGHLLFRFHFEIPSKLIPIREMDWAELFKKSVDAESGRNSGFGNMKTALSEISEPQKGIIRAFSSNSEIIAAIIQKTRRIPLFQKWERDF